MPTVFRVFVKPGDPDCEALQFIWDTLDDINAMGITLKIEKYADADLTTDAVKALSARGITRLPAMIAADGSVFIGVANIKKVFNSNLARFRTTSSPKTVGEFFAQEMFVEDRRGNRVPRMDDEEDDDENIRRQIDQRMAAYRDRAPRHRGGGDERDNDSPEPPRRRRDRDRRRDDDRTDDSRRRRRERARDDDDYDDYDDNVGEDYDRGNNRGGRHFSASDDARGDSMDDLMISAWMNNTEQ